MNKKIILIVSLLSLSNPVITNDLSVDGNIDEYESKSFPIIIKSNTLRDIFSSGLMGYEINSEMFNIERGDDFISINSKDNLRLIDESKFDISYRLMLNDLGNYVVEDGFLENSNGYVLFDFEINQSLLGDTVDMIGLLSSAHNLSFDSYSKIKNNYDFFSEYSEKMITESLSFKKEGELVDFQNISFVIDGVLEVRFVGTVIISDIIKIKEGVLHYNIIDKQLLSILNARGFSFSGSEDILKIENTTLDDLILKII